MGIDAQEAGPTDVALLDETIGANLARTVAAHGDREALVARHQGIRWTYREFAERVDQLARGLMGLGLEPGDRVGLWSPNYAEWTLLQFATAEIGVILVNINPAYRTHELAYALNQSGCRILFAAPSFKTSDYMDMVEQVQPDVPGLERAVFFWEDDWDELVAGAGGASDEALAERRAGLSPDDPINIQYTSGTTGFPKGATLTHRNILNNGYFTAEQQRLQPGDRLCIPVPFYHCFGMVMGNLGCVTHGATMVDPVRLLRALATCSRRSRPNGARRCTACRRCSSPSWPTPTSTRFDLSSLRTGVMAGSPCPVEVMKQCVDRMHMDDVTICYGMTETSPVSTQTLPDDSLASPHRHGRSGPPPRRDPHRRSGHGRHVAARETGEFCTRGYSVMQGYWNDPDRTAEAIDADGWMHTGDLAVMADDGYVNIVGRIKDLVIRGGENVYPREVEEFLYTHPDVEDVQVIGVPDERYGEELMAWVKVRPGASAPPSTPRTSGRSARARSPTTRSRATSRSSTSSR